MRLTQSASQWCASLLLLVAAGTHIPLIQDHLEEAPYVGRLFIALSVVCIVLAVVILFVDHVGVWLLSAAVCFAAVVAFLTSRTVGLRRSATTSATGRTRWASRPSRPRRSWSPWPGSTSATPGLPGPPPDARPRPADRRSRAVR
jgi:hypothetical protein